MNFFRRVYLVIITLGRMKNGLRMVLGGQLHRASQPKLVFLPPSECGFDTHLFLDHISETVEDTETAIVSLVS